MKRIAVILICLAFAKMAQAQTPTWKTTLNNIQPGQPSDFGTDNDAPINIFTNNQQRMSIDKDGNIIFNGLSGSGGSRFLQVDNDGLLSNWEGSTMNANKILFGDNTWKPFPFTITGSDIYMPAVDARFGIGTSSPNSELDVVGSGKFSGNLQVDGILSLGDMNIKQVAAVGSSPSILQFGDPQTAKPFVLPCNWNWQPLAAWTVPAIIQIHGNTSVINIGTEILGDGVISLEPITPPGSQKLKLNPSCNNDVEICQGGGFTKMHYNAGVGGMLKIGSNTSIPPTSQLDIHVNSSLTKAITVTDPLLTTTNKNIFEMSKTGETVLGVDVQSASGSMLTIGQPLWSNLCLSLVDNSVLPNIPVFSVRGDGFTEIIATNFQAISVKDHYHASIETFGVETSGHTFIKTTNTKAFSIHNSSNNNNETFTIEKNGYTEIKVYSPSGMPNPYSSGHRAFTIRDMSGTPKDIFAVNSNGKVYSREVEISLVQNFPDYVFANSYNLMPINELEHYIMTNKHLPGFKTADFYEKNGINVNEMFISQQEKIEELTLYIIQLEKRLNSIENGR